MRLITCSILFSILTFSACSLFPNDDDSSSDINLLELQQHWVHSFEEESQESDVNIYRPHNYKEFPPSRFRMQYIFEEDGACKWYFLSPDDSHYFISGKWQLDTGDAEVIIIEQEEQGVRARKRILELNKKVLRMKHIDTE